MSTPIHTCAAHQRPFSAFAFATSLPLAPNPLSFAINKFVPPVHTPSPRIPSRATNLIRASVQAGPLLPIVSLLLSATPSTPPPHIRSVQHPAQIASTVSNRFASHTSHGALAVVSPSDAVPEKLRFNVNDRLSFWFSEFLMWHPSARVVALLAATLLFMFIGSFLYRLADPQQKEAPHPFWHSVRAIANPLEDDWESNYLRATSITLAAIGMVFFAVLVGMVTESVESAVHAVDGARSSVIVKDHILVCGWGPHVSQILKDISSLSNQIPVVVLAKPDKKSIMFSQLRETLPEEQLRKLRLFYRPGIPFLKDDLSRVAATRARKIILITERHGDPADADRQTLSRAMALRQNLPGFTGDIVAELRSERDERILKTILENTRARSVETVNARKLLYRFMAQAIRQPGLADVVTDLMGDDIRLVFHVKAADKIAPHLVGSKVSTLKPTSVQRSILCGFVTDGSLTMGLDSNLIVQPSTELLLLGDQQNGANAKHVHSSPPKGTIIRPASIRMEETKKEPESYLICGWRPELRHMLRELDKILVRGSKVTILAEDAPEKPGKTFKNLSLSAIHKRADRFENLEELFHQNHKGFDHVVILNSAFSDNALQESTGTEEDTATLASLAYLNELLQSQEQGQHGVETVVTVELLNERIARMAKDQGYVVNSILPHNLSAKIAAQTVRDSRLNSVWNELLSQEGREVYLRPCGVYEGVPSSRKSFARIADDISGCGDIVIGYIRGDGLVTINPSEDDRIALREWSAKDMLIVLSEK
ncbi:unnamed protein product [Agarophyton chilense]|eukprot:gb/GEZJ01002176.1/.p1 GENE.gb/GEZJ01002176.1/~~gb/GEZJ01002176.1/.p1  ORF type:complete len:769 (+),score=91.52 gb/GEZJ01002176.1/:4179-6485(+)